MSEQTDSPTRSDRPGAKPTRIAVTYECDGRMKTVVLDPTHLPIFFFDAKRRDQVWGSGTQAKTLRTEEDWNWFRDCRDERVLVEGPYDAEGEPGSGDCFCFEDDNGMRYCVCTT